MNDLDPRRLRHFLAVAEHLNYGRAAESLHLAQPALSRSIKALEQQLGVRLFDRSTAGTRLTAVGRSLVPEAVALLEHGESLVRRLRVLAREGRSVTIGFAPGLLVTSVVRHLEQERHGLRVEVVRMSWVEQISALRDGQLDASFAHRPFDDDGLAVVSLLREPRLVALEKGHPLARRSSLRLAEVHDELLLQPRAAVPEWRGATSVPGSRPAAPTLTSPAPPGAQTGASPVRPAAPTVEEKLERVASGRGVVIVPASTARYYNNPGISYVHVADLAPVQVCLATVAGRRSASVRALQQVAVREAGSLVHGETDQEELDADAV